jgi:flagellar basal-body rod modification protein FlgD
MNVSTTASAATASGTAAGSRTGLADNFDSFLKLLTTQLRSQDPLAPMDAAQFTQQLVQFSGVEQSIKTNDQLGQLVDLFQAEQSSRALDYLGATVEAAGGAVRLGAANRPQISYQLDRSAASVTINLRDELGRLVASRVGATTAGAHSLAWDGLSTAGERLPPGLYRVEVVALDQAGAAVPATTRTAGTVEAVEIADGQLLLSVDGVMVPVAALTRISRPAAAAA